MNWSGVAGFSLPRHRSGAASLGFRSPTCRSIGGAKKASGWTLPITTLDRLLSTPSVRTKIGFEIKDDKLLTSLPPDEAIKPLKRIVLDLAEGKENVTKLKLVSQQVAYVSRFGKTDTPDLLKKTGSSRARKVSLRKTLRRRSNHPRRKKGRDQYHVTPLCQNPAS